MTTDPDVPVKPRRRFLLIALKIIGVHLILILAALVFICIHENKQAERDWNEFKDHWEAKGEIFDLEKLIPPAPPNEENFAAAPIIAEIFANKTLPRLANMRFDKLPGLKRARPGNLAAMTSKSRRNALGAVGYNLIDYVNIKNPDTTASETQTAKAILKILEPLSPLIDELDQASLRPKFRVLSFDGVMKNNVYWSMSILPDSVDILVLRARARLTSGDSSGAFNDILTIIRCAKLTSSVAFPGTHQSDLELYGKALQAIWEGLESHRLDSTELKMLMTALRDHDTQRHFIEITRIKRAHLLKEFDKLSGQNFSWNHTEIGSIALAYKILGLSKTFWYRNKLNYSKFIQEHQLSINGKINTEQIIPDNSSRAWADFHALSKHRFLSHNPDAALLRLTITSVFFFKQDSVAHVSARIDLARVAIALELYRREHGKYPDTLVQLAPTYIENLPLDLLTGASLHYRIKADGTPLVYSTGWDKIDDGGLPRQRLTSGDWVWQYTLPDNFDVKAWRTR